MMGGINGTYVTEEKLMRNLRRMTLKVGVRLETYGCDVVLYVGLLEWTF
jgi:hypothetical protein